MAVWFRFLVGRPWKRRCEIAVVSLGAVVCTQLTAGFHGSSQPERKFELNKPMPVVRGMFQSLLSGRGVSLVEIGFWREDGSSKKQEELMMILQPESLCLHSGWATTIHSWSKQLTAMGVC